MTARRILAASAAVFLVAVGAAAQESPLVKPQTENDRPVQREPRLARRSDGAQFTASIFDAYDWTRLTDSSGGEADPEKLAPVQQSGNRVGVDGRLEYTRLRRRYSVELDGRSAVNFYTTAGEQLAAAALQTQESRRLGRQTVVSANQWFSYSPFFGLDVSAGGGGSAFSPQGLESWFSFAANTASVSQYGAGGSITHQLGERASLSGSYVRGFQSIEGTPKDTTWDRVSARFSQSIARGLGYHVGYGLLRGDNISVDGSVVHTIDAGLDVSRSLSVSRRTIVSFSTGSAIVRNEPNQAGVLGRQGSVRLLGRASLEHHMGRTWSAIASYGRDYQFLIGYDSPVLLDNASIALSGALNSRTRAGVSANYLLGNFDVTASRPQEEHLHTAGGTAWVQREVSRRFAAYVQYRFFRQDIPAPIQLITVPTAFQRSGVRAGLTLTVPRAR
jgi:hypothetical protein